MSTFTPYIGVTDFDSPFAVRETLKYFKKYFPDPSERKLMVGHMMSYKTLNGIPSSWSDIWLKSSSLSDLFIDDPSAYNTLHYADYEGKTSAGDLGRALGQCGVHIHALQLDMILPDNMMLKKIKKIHKVDMILQINKETLVKVAHDPKVLGDLTANLYMGIVDVCLLDLSAGRGKEIDAAKLAPYVSELQDRGFYVAIAGGFGPDTMHRAELILSNYGLISTDAQGQLRPSKDAHDPLDYQFVRDYIKSARQYL